jgi:hypothetical protein
MTYSMRGNDNLQANFKSVKAAASEVPPMQANGAAERGWVIHVGLSALSTWTCLYC